MKNENSLNKGISCNVKGCIFNEDSQGCNLDKVSISKGDGNHHFCKSYIPFQDENEYKFPFEKQECITDNIESSEEYFDFGDLMEDIENKIDD